MVKGGVVVEGGVIDDLINDVLELTLKWMVEEALCSRL